jgi:D-glycero-beta-D-manno-heptose-7-phosphate kinase
MRKKAVSQIVNRFKGKKIAVVGDLMLDVYVWGKVSRISPEAPVPIVHVKEKTYTLGGAANVMSNITSLGGEALAFGIIGNGKNGTFLLNLMNEQGINTKNIIIDKNYLTIEKQRIMADSQQLARVDYENQESVSRKIKESITNSIISMINNSEVDAVIFEDYAKGLLSNEMINQVIQKAKSKNIPIALDPHPSHKLDVKGLTLMTPNQSESFTLAGVYPKELSEPVYKDPSLLNVAEKLNAEWNVKQLLITLGANGMALFEQGKDVIHIPTKAKEVFDVTGAGDTVIASYTLALLGGATGHEASEISNHAAGAIVGRVGSSSVTSDDLVNLFL